ncbi:MAG: isochorismatase family protein [Candidatus Competibacteraceae bacterium]|nr:MAG: isochorismatase family protein [Candidatus Competibacteraceae bacterium]
MQTRRNRPIRRSRHPRPPCSALNESFFVVLLEDCCAAGTEDLHHKELEILNMIYCQVMSSAELFDLMGLR